MDLESLALLYLEEKACELHKIELEGVIEVNSPYFMGEILHPEDMPRVDQGLWDFATRGDENEVYTYVQRLRLLHGEEYKPYFTCVRLDLARRRFCGVTTCLVSGDSFTREVGSLLDSSRYINQHIAIYTSLSRREREVISWVCAGKSATEIGDALFLSPHTIEKHKKNIFAKSQFRSNAELMKFAMNFNLVQKVAD